MGELTFNSPGVSTREIDLSGPSQVTPVGIPAGVIGTSVQGPAFVPVTVASYNDFVARFGPSDGEKFGPIAFYEWMKNSQAGTYMRVLGVGDGKKRLASAGANSAGETVPAGGVKNAGFIVGAKEVQSNGNIGRNPWAKDGGIQGRTYFLGAFMSQSETGASTEEASGWFKEAGYGDIGNVAQPVVRGVLMAPSGVLLSLSGNFQTAVTASEIAVGNWAAGYDGGHTVGAVSLANSSDYTFVMLLNGHTNTSQYPNLYTASFSPNNANYFPTVFNTDPTLIEKAGHYLYTYYDVFPAYAVVTGSGVYAVSSSIANREPAAFLLTSSVGRNSGTTAIPNFENFSDRFKTAGSPWVISQEFGGKVKNLFKVHLLDDGETPTDDVKISIQNIAKSNVDDDYGSFDLVVRRWMNPDGDGNYDSDLSPQVIQSFLGLSLDPTSDDYIARRIGDAYTYFDFDKSSASQKLVTEGTHANKSVYIRVEVADDVDDAIIDKTALPVGFRGPKHLLTSGSSIMSTPLYPATYAGDADAGSAAAAGTMIATTDWGNKLATPQIPYRNTISLNEGTSKTAASYLHWGVQFEVNDNAKQPNNSTTLNKSVASFAKYYPDFDTGNKKAWIGDNPNAVDANGTVFNSDRFNNNIFTMERIQILTQSSADKVDSTQWQAAVYRRTGVLSGALQDSYQKWHSGRFLNVKKDFGEAASKKYRQFSFFCQGGFNGVNIFDSDKANLRNGAAVREMNDSNQGTAVGPTISAYMKALDIMAEKSDVDIQLLCIPGIRETKITDHAIDKVEDRFDAMYIMDIEERDDLNNVVTGSTQIISVGNTVTDFKGRNLDSSFAAAYFPDVFITDPNSGNSTRCPPSVAVLGAFALNDKVAYPWYAAAGFTRGALESVLQEKVDLNRNNLDALYSADINPLTSFPTASGVVVFGQKTLLAAASALDRVNVRRLLIDIRRKVRAVADTFLFEPNRESTLAKFSAQVNPILARIQQQQGLDRYKVIIDTTTTTQADIENNTVRGKIFLQPTRSLEFISLDFVVTNSGTDI